MTQERTQENKNRLTEIVFILDASGSMHGLESDPIGGFNSMLDKQKKLGGEAYVSTVLFDNDSKVIHDRKPIATIAPMTDRDYSVGGCTALLDAVGGAIHHIGNIHKYAREEDRPDKTLFVIITDGYENASCEYTYDKVKHQITRQQEKYGWEFMFLGANIDAAKEASKYGIKKDMAVNFVCDRKGTALNYEAVSEAISSMRMGGVVGDVWRDKIDADYAKRRK